MLTSGRIWLFLLVAAAGGGIAYLCDSPNRDLRWWKRQIEATIPLGTEMAEVKEWLHNRHLEFVTHGRKLRTGWYEEYFVANGEFDIWFTFDEAGRLAKYEVDCLILLDLRRVPAADRLD